MQLAELAARSGVSVATIKYYLREGLLPKGEGVGGGRATYGELHLRRLAFVRTLMELGGCSVRQVRAVVLALGAGDADAAFGGMLPIPDDPADPREPTALVEVGRFLDRAGVASDLDHPARRVLARALLALRDAGREVDAEVFRPYLRAAAWLVTEELEADDPGMTTEAAVVSAVAADAAIVALRRIARAGGRRGQGRIT